MVGSRKHNADDVVAVRLVRQVEQPAVDAGRARDLPLLAQVNVGFRRGEPIGAACLDFDETESSLLVSDDVDLGRDERPAAVSAYGQLEVRSDKKVARLFEMPGGQLFALPFEGEVRCQFFSG